ncbi:MAG: hypothetical protein AAFO83_04240 [Cyanobacteria bacterium J06607_13]
MAYSLLKIAQRIVQNAAQNAYDWSRRWVVGLVNFLWRGVGRRSPKHNFQEIERTVEQAVEQAVRQLNLAVDEQAVEDTTGVCFSIADRDDNRLVVVQEIPVSERLEGVESALMAKIRLAIWDVHGLAVYAIALVEPSSLATACSGRSQRDGCKMNFIAGNLPIVADWSENPGLTSEVRALLDEIDLLAQQLVRRPAG